MSDIQEKFIALLQKFVHAVEQNEPEALAGLFAEDGVYIDGFYGPFRGREAIAGMVRDHFWGTAHNFKWEMRSPAAHDHTGYAHYFFSYDYFGDNPDGPVKRVMFEGMARFDFSADGFINRYREVFDRGAAVSQLGFPAGRIAEAADKTAKRLRAMPDAKVHLDRK